MNLSKIKTIILASSITFLAISLISFPQESVKASIRGLEMWWEIVFPSLLPFFIVSEILIGFGVVKFIGILLEPFMRPFFNVPGVGGFAWAMGMSSGFPAGAKITARLREEGHLSKVEAERLVSFTNCSNPLFIFGAVAVGFFYNPHLGLVLALAHYLSNFTVGFIMRFYGKEKAKRPKVKDKLSLKNAFRELHLTRINDKRPIGKLLGDAVMSSIQTLLMVGGFIIFFSVINQILFHIGITNVLGNVVKFFLNIFQIPSSLSVPFISGLFEITLGNKLTSESLDATLLEKAIISSFILAFSGFSVHAQVASILAQTDISYKPFFFGRILQGFFASIYTFLLWGPVYEKYKNIESYGTIPATGFIENSILPNFHRLAEIGPIITIVALFIYTILYYRKIVIEK